jgi:hypothetical protein
MKLRLRTAIAVLTSALILPIASATAITVAATPANAAENSDYLAVAYSPSIGGAYIGRSPDKSLALGYAYNDCVRSGQRAVGGAYRNDCSGGTWVRYGYVSLAGTHPLGHFLPEGTPHAWGAGYGSTGPSAESWAMQSCEEYRQQHNVEPPCVSWKSAGTPGIDQIPEDQRQTEGGSWSI